MQVLQIINQPGPLPIKAEFNAPLDGPALLVVTSSLWTSVTHTPLQLFVALGGNQIATGQMWSNQVGTHRVLPTLFIGFSLTFGQHTLGLTLGGSGVTSDVNDIFNASLDLLTEDLLTEDLLTEDLLIGEHWRGKTGIAGGFSIEQPTAPMHV